MPQLLLAVSSAAATTLFAQGALAQNCASMDPSQWPAAARPYFMIAFDTSGSMASQLGSVNTCGFGDGAPTSGRMRISHGRCAINKTIRAFGGEVNFGLASFARRMTNCGATCDFYGTTSCSWSNLPNNSAGAACTTGCGAEPTPSAPNSSSRAGANVLVGLDSDIVSPPTDNRASLLAWVDGSCATSGGVSQELFPDGCTPLNGILRDMYRYYSASWTYPGGGTTFTSPLGSEANGERACRSVNVILVTDGGETCDCTDGTNCEGEAGIPPDPVDAAADLFNGFDKDGIHWNVRTYVIDFGSTDGAKADAIADAGDDGLSNSSASAYYAGEEIALAQAFATIISSAIRPEECNNEDDNCNTCVDEGYLHYCNKDKTCCSWATPTERQDCLDDYEDSVVAHPPDGTLELLPCTTEAQYADSSTWLCYNPGEICDVVDNNCNGDIDENVLTCGNPPHCPLPEEECNGEDDDCDGFVDEDDVCGDCSPSAETCNGCDDDCDGWVDNGTFAAIPCGFSPPAWCEGLLNCQAPVAVAQGGCVAGRGYGACSVSAPDETCNGIDDNCDGFIDNGLVDTPCEPWPGVDYDGQHTQCERGTSSCINGHEQCLGGVGPGDTEYCDGIDNDCDGFVDNGTVWGVGQDCGSNNPPCVLGSTICENGALVCDGGIAPSNEICNGADDDCDGAVDEAPLFDAPASGETGCWAEPGNCCSHGTLHWCPPSPLPPTQCHDAGTLTPPCHAGTLACDGSAGWICALPIPPDTEVCDGIDNDCNGTADDGDLEGVGDECGPDILPCEPGALICDNGLLVCDGGTPPIPEICNGIDDDCDTFVDDGLAINDPCEASYDTEDYPGDRSGPPCQPGILQCCLAGNPDCTLGELYCAGGQGPVPEVCDGIDNDCDGDVDETGAAPDGLDGTANPFPPPDANLGDACGLSVGLCEPGDWGCVNGLFVCLGAVGATPELCDCSDNDCDGSSDELPGDGEQALCSEGKDCVHIGGSSGYCMCAPLCSTGEYPCPTGQECVDATVSHTYGSSSPEEARYCVSDPCGDCTNRTITDTQGETVCQPAGLDPEGCVLTPECVCRGQVGCREPCYGVTCTGGLVCSDFGPTPGQCVVDSCYQTGCPGCYRACHDGDCVANPCADAECDPDQFCRPNADWSDFECVGSCAEVDCDTGFECVDGECVATCVPACSDEQVCDLTAEGGPNCVDNLCLAQDPCADGSCCDPRTGQCGDCPCEGVLCPEGQSCEDGQCDSGGGGEGGGGGGTGGSGQGGGAGEAGSGTGATGGGPGPEPQGAANGIWRLSTGGGGCLCRIGAVGAGAGGNGLGSLVLLGIGVALARRRGAGRVHARPNEAPAWQRLPGAALLASLLGVAPLASGCTTEAACFGDQCDGVGGAGADAGVGNSAAAGGNEGGGTGEGGECIFGCGGGGGQGGGGCQVTNGGEEICDGLDNDCNGTIDDDFDLHNPETCGTCTNNCFTVLKNVQASGVTCTWNGVEGDPGACDFTDCADDYFDYDPQEPGCEYYCLKAADDDTLCNNRDDDCDTEVDEDVDLCGDENNCGRCGTVCAVAHGLGVCVHEGAAACNDSNTACEIDVCDDPDNDGEPEWHDVDHSFATGCEYPCDPTNGGVEICDGLDNDCDGRIDTLDDLSGDARLNQACQGDPDGICADPVAHGGLTACQAAQVVCVGPDVLVENEVPEICNGDDDDCDGLVDDSPTDAGDACGQSGIYPCRIGTIQCVASPSPHLDCVGDIPPGDEVCNGVDDDCDGHIDLKQNGDPPTGMGVACNVPPPPPANMTTPCSGGTLTCVGGAVICEDDQGPVVTTDSCDEDSNCNGVNDWVLTHSLQTDIQNCGQCGNDCNEDPDFEGTVVTCVAGSCTPQGCKPGYYDLDGDELCEYPCTFRGSEQCNHLDDDCDGDVDEGMVAPSKVNLCGISPAATAPECTSQVTVGCVETSPGTWGWRCTFPAGVCSGGCWPDDEICEDAGLDNDCDGSVNENVSNWHRPCWSDAGMDPPGHGACRDDGLFQCNGPGATLCDAAPNDCADLPQGCTEKCDGVDNDCDGLVDESKAQNGADAFYVRPIVTKIRTSPELWIFSYEASRPNADGTTPGTGNGYWCAGNECTLGVPPAPAGTPLDETPACSVPGKMPWFNVTPAEAEQTCEAMGGFVCDVDESTSVNGDWERACKGQSGTCTWAYGSGCTTGYDQPNRRCSIDAYNGATFLGLDCVGTVNANGSNDQDCLFATGTNGGSTEYTKPYLCYADWSNSTWGNSATCSGDSPTTTCRYVYDLTGNLREIAFADWDDGVDPVDPSDDTWDYRLMGGALNSLQSGANCDFTYYSVPETFKLFDTGFRCCFSSSPL